MTAAETLAFDLASSLWVYPIIVVLAAADGLTIVLPSETVVAGLASTAVSLGAPNLALLGLTAALGAHIGDVVVFGLGRLLGHSRWLREGTRVGRLLGWTRRRLETQGPLYIMSARYIPYGRLLVNAAAGSSGYPFRRFLVLSGLGCTIWAGAYIGIGAGAGAWFGDQWWIALILAIVVAVLAGFGADQLVRRSGNV